MKDSMKYFVVPGMFFEELGFTYYGPIDGHSYEDLFRSIRYAKKTEGPIILHVITKKVKVIVQRNRIRSVHGMVLDPIKSIQVNH